jgi:cytochrome c biogenesis protein CcmG/thiol:disulfide interchange protein DsbE
MAIDSLMGARPTPSPFRCPIIEMPICATRSRTLTRFLTWAFLVCLPLAATLARAADGLDLEQYRGKVVLLDFWASWCQPCRQSFPWLNEMQAKYADRGLVVIGVNVDRVQSDAQRFLHDVPAAFHIVYDPDGALAARYDVPGMPVSYVVDRNGAIVGHHIGFRNATRTERETQLQQLLGATAATSH